MADWEMDWAGRSFAIGVLLERKEVLERCVAQLRLQREWARAQVCADKLTRLQLEMLDVRIEKLENARANAAGELIGKLAAASR